MVTKMVLGLIMDHSVNHQIPDKIQRDLAFGGGGEVSNVHQKGIKVHLLLFHAIMNCIFSISYLLFNFIFSVLAASPHDPIKIMKDELKQQYHRKFSHVSPVPWNQHFIVELENIYTSVKVISVPKGQRGSVHIPDILRYYSLLLINAYRSGTVNSKSFVGKVLLRIKRKFELTYAL